MDERKNKLRRFIEDSDIPSDLKAKEIAIVNNDEFSAPEIEMALAKLIAEEFDKKMEAAGITDITPSREVQEAYNAFSIEAEQAEKDLGDDMRFVDENLKIIRQTAEEIQKTAMQTDIQAGQK